MASEDFELKTLVESCYRTGVTLEVLALHNTSATPMLLKIRDECDYLDDALNQVSIVANFEGQLRFLKNPEQQRGLEDTLKACSGTLEDISTELQNIRYAALPNDPPEKYSNETERVQARVKYLWNENRMQGYLRRLNTERDELRMSLLAYKQESLDAKHELPRVQPFRKYIRLGALEYQESHIMPSHEGPQSRHSVDEPMEGTTPNTEIPDSSIHGSASEQSYPPTITSSTSIPTKGSPPTLNSPADSRGNGSQNSMEGVETEATRPVQDNATKLTARVQLTGWEPVYDGPYSAVYKGRWNNQEVAIKVIRTAGPSGMTREKLRRESQTWMRLRHANILSVYGLCTDDRFGEYGALVSPWCSHGISSEHLRQFSDKPAERVRLLFEVAQGLTFLHSRQPVVVHGNLKPTNILICSNGMAKLCDYGLMSLIQEEANVVHTGTERYLSKELVATEYPIPTPASDCYAFGCVALEFAYLQLPYAQHTTISDIRSDISNGLPPAKRFAVSDDHPGHIILWHLLEACWRLEPNDRPSARDICVPLSAQASLIIGALERYLPL